MAVFSSQHIYILQIKFSDEINWILDFLSLKTEANWKMSQVCVYKIVIW